MPLLRGLGQSPSCDGRPQRRFSAVPRLDAILKDRASRHASLDRIARALHLPITALFEDEPPPPQPSRDEALIAAIVAELRGHDANYLRGVRSMLRVLTRMVGESPGD